MLYSERHRQDGQLDLAAIDGALTLISRIIHKIKKKIKTNNFILYYTIARGFSYPDIKCDGSIVILLSRARSSIFIVVNCFVSNNKNDRRLSLLCIGFISMEIVKAANAWYQRRICCHCNLPLLGLLVNVAGVVYCGEHVRHLF